MSYLPTYAELVAAQFSPDGSAGYTMHMSRKALPELTGLSVRQAYRLHELNYSAS